MKYKEQTVEEFDKEIADSVKEQILRASQNFKLEQKYIDSLLLKLQESGASGVPIQELKEKINIPELENCLDYLVEFLDKNDGGVIITKGYKENRVFLESAGNYYIEQYLSGEN